jgi:hypothetical protein
MFFGTLLKNNCNGIAFTTVSYCLHINVGNKKVNVHFLFFFIYETFYDQARASILIAAVCGTRIYYCHVGYTPSSMKIIVRIETIASDLASTLCQKVDAMRLTVIETR